MKARVKHDFRWDGISFKRGALYIIKPIPSRLPECDGVYAKNKFICDIGSPLFKDHFTLVDDPQPKLKISQDRFVMVQNPNHVNQVDVYEELGGGMISSVATFDRRNIAEEVVNYLNQPVNRISKDTEDKITELMEKIDGQTRENIIERAIDVLYMAHMK